MDLIIIAITILSNTLIQAAQEWIDELNMFD